MSKNNRGVTWASLITLLGLAVVGLLWPGILNAQEPGGVDTGTTIRVRTDGEISATEADGRVFSGTVARDAVNSDGVMEVPKGSDVELIVRRVSNTEFALDLDSLTVNGSRYAVENDRDHAIGLLGVIVGLIAGGEGKAAQVSTQGASINVPNESLLTFRLARPLRARITDNGFTNNGIRYHQPGGEEYARRQKPAKYSNGSGMISVGADSGSTGTARGTVLFTCRSMTKLRRFLPRDRRAFKALHGWLKAMCILSSYRMQTATKSPATNSTCERIGSVISGPGEPTPKTGSNKN